MTERESKEESARDREGRVREREKEKSKERDLSQERFLSPASLDQELALHFAYCENSVI